MTTRNGLSSILAEQYRLIARHFEAGEPVKAWGISLKLIGEIPNHAAAKVNHAKIAQVLGSGPIKGIPTPLVS
jgi:hypothetical protein